MLAIPKRLKVWPGGTKRKSNIFLASLCKNKCASGVAKKFTQRTWARRNKKRRSKKEIWIKPNILIGSQAKRRDLCLAVTMASVTVHQNPPDTLSAIQVPLSNAFLPFSLHLGQNLIKKCTR